MSEKEIELAAHIPQIPDEAIEFAKAVGELAEKFGMARVSMDIEVDTGWHSKYRERLEEREQICQQMTVRVSRKDGRGRPRTQIFIDANIRITKPVVYESDSTD